MSAMESTALAKPAKDEISIVAGEVLVLGGIYGRQSACQHGERAPAGVESGAMGDAIDAARQPADDGEARPRQAACRGPFG